MPVRVEVRDGIAIAVKRSDAHEADRLRRAAHPGVVELLAARQADDGLDLDLAFAGRPLATLSELPVEQLAAVIAAVADTLADLHQLGIMHGRIDASHVLVGEGGRPLLCGFSGSGDGAPHDDVRAVGELLTRLLGDEIEADPIPDRWFGRRRSSSACIRRALLNLADQASADETSRRPTARRLAAAIAASVPNAALPRAAPPSAPAPTQADARTRPMGRTGLLVVIAGLALIGLGARSLRGPVEPNASGSSPTTTESMVQPMPTTTSVPPSPPACATGGVADIDGDGCQDPVAVDGSVVAVGERRYQVGEPDDMVAVGDWDCDGRATPAALRPRTGEIFLFPSWTDGEITVRAVSRVAGARRLFVERLDRGCDGLAVELADGDRAAVWPAEAR